MADVQLPDMQVKIIPDTTTVGPAMADAGKAAKKQFEESSKGAGDEFNKELEGSTSKTKSFLNGIGRYAKEAFGKAGRESGDELGDELKKSAEAKTESLGDELKKTVGEEIGKAIVDKLTELPGFDKVQAAAKRVTDVTVPAADALRGTRDILARFKEGDLGAAFTGIHTAIAEAEKAAKNVGVDVSKWTPGLDGTISKIAEVSNNVQSLRSGYKAFVEAVETLSPRIATALKSALGPVGWALIAAYVAYEAIEWLDRLTPQDERDRRLPSLQSPIKIPPPGTSGPLNPFRVPGGVEVAPGATVNENAPPIPKPWSPFQLPGGVEVAPGAVVIEGRKDGGPVGDTDWDAVAQGESGGNWHINTGNGYFGGLQFDLPTWREFGGPQFAPRPDLASRDQQITVAERVPVSQRANRWPNTYRLGAGKGMSTHATLGPSSQSPATTTPSAGATGATATGGVGDQGQLLAKGFMSGLLQAVGLDLGALKGLAGMSGGDGAALPGLEAFTNPGAAISAAVGAGGGAIDRATQITNNYHGDVAAFTANGVGSVADQQAVALSSNRAMYTPKVVNG